MMMGISKFFHPAFNAAFTLGTSALSIGFTL